MLNSGRVECVWSVDFSICTLWIILHSSFRDHICDGCWQSWPSKLPSPLWLFFADKMLIHWCPLHHFPLFFSPLFLSVGVLFLAVAFEALIMFVYDIISILYKTPFSHFYFLHYHLVSVQGSHLYSQMCSIWQRSTHFLTSSGIFLFVEIFLC